MWVGGSYDIVHLRRVFVLYVKDHVIKFRRVLCDVRQGKLSLSLREPHGGLFGLERRNTNTDVVERKRRRRIGRLPRPCRKVRFLLHYLSRRQTMGV